jgi:hypothetical protein
MQCHARCSPFICEQAFDQRENDYGHKHLPLARAIFMAIIIKVKFHEPKKISQKRKPAPSTPSEMRRKKKEKFGG